jgi:hypothetical protein
MHPLHGGRICRREHDRDAVPRHVDLHCAERDPLREEPLPVSQDPLVERLKLSQRVPGGPHHEPGSRVEAGADPCLVLSGAVREQHNDDARVLLVDVHAGEPIRVAHPVGAHERQNRVGVGRPALEVTHLTGEQRDSELRARCCWIGEGCENPRLVRPEAERRPEPHSLIEP